MDTGTDDETGSDEIPTPLRSACAIVALECVGLLAAAGFLVVSTIVGHPSGLGRALFGAALALAGALLLGGALRGLLRLNPAARTPVVVMQLLAIPVAYSLAFQAGRVAYGGPILIAALSVLYLLFTPPARLALDRQSPR